MLITISAMMLSCNSQIDDTNYISVKQNGLWGVVDKTGQFVVQPQYKRLTSFSNGIAAFFNDENKGGYVNYKGEVIITPQYVALTKFSEGIAFVKLTDNTIIAIDTKGNILFQLPQNIVQIRNFSEGLAAYKDNNNKWGFLDIKGNIAINPAYEAIYDFSEGYAAFKSNNLWGYIDKAGNIAVNPEFVNNVTNVRTGATNDISFKEGVAVALKINTPNKGVIDKNGNWVINPQFRDARACFSEGLVAFQENGKWGFMDLQGNKVITPQFSDVRDFHSGLAWAQLQMTKGFIDKTGKFVITPSVLQEYSDFYGDIAFFSESNGQHPRPKYSYGMIDAKGKTLILPNLDDFSIPQYEQKFEYITR